MCNITLYFGLNVSCRKFQYLFSMFFSMFQCLFLKYVFGHIWSHFMHCTMYILLVLSAGFSLSIGKAMVFLNRKIYCLTTTVLWTPMIRM